MVVIELFAKIDGSGRKMLSRSRGYKMDFKGYTSEMGWGFRTLCWFLFLHHSYSLPDGDLCGWMKGRKYYVEAGEGGVISVRNASSPSPSSPPQRCSVELATCPACHLSVAVERLAIPPCSHDNTCRCDYLWLKESSYSKSGVEYCGFTGENGTRQELVFESKTKLVSVDFLYSGSYGEAFSLHFSAQKNVYAIRGGWEEGSNGSSGVLESPNFPAGYPSDYSAEWTLRNEDPNGAVRLIFSDFQLALWSYLEVLDSNGSRLGLWSGSAFRPPAISSLGPGLVVRFAANDEYPGAGFRAHYTFVGPAEKDWVDRPSTDCGGLVEESGGAITMAGVAGAFDCVWLLRPRPPTPHAHLALRLAQFHAIGGLGSLQVRQGQNSDGTLLPQAPGRELVATSTGGLYLRLSAKFTPESHLALVYAAFTYGGCFAASDLECHNGRCLARSLRCDGFNHCGDGSDEAACFGGKGGAAVPEAHWWRTLTPNYYFPAANKGGEGGTSTLLLVASAAGLGMFVLTAAVILAKLHRQTRQDEPLSREILRTISADLEAESTPVHQGGDLPLYDPPPSYEDVVKLYQPPPPYTRVNRERQRTGRTRGVQNRGYQGDLSDGAVPKVHSRRQRTREQTRGDLSHSLVLRVALPEEPPSPARNHEAVYRRQNSDTSSSLTERYDLQKSSACDMDTNFTSDFDERNASDPADSPTKKEGLPPGGKMELASSQAQVSEQCGCAGACTCRLLAASIAKQQSFRNVMQRGLRVATAGTTNSDTSPSRRKQSRSGPGSPTTACPPGYEEGETPVHRRSFSGTGDNSAWDSTTSSSTSQVRHLASALLDGIQQSLVSRTPEVQQSSQGNWTDLLMPGRKRSTDPSSFTGSSKLWTVGDTLPLLDGSSQQPTVVKCDPPSPNKSNDPCEGRE